MAYLSIVSNHVNPFMATMYPSSDSHFQQDNTPCHKAPIISNWFLEHDNEFTVHSHQISTQSIFGMWWNGSFMPWMCIPQISIN